MECHQIHPPGDLGETGEDEGLLQDSAEPRWTDSTLTFLGQSHLVLTFLVFRKFLERKQTRTVTKRLLAEAPESGLLTRFRLNQKHLRFCVYYHDWVKHKITCPP